MEVHPQLRSPLSGIASLGGQVGSDEEAVDGSHCVKHFQFQLVQLIFRVEEALRRFIRRCVAR